MNHRANDIAIDHLPDRQSVRRMCRRKRRRRRRVVKGGCFSRPKQLGKIEGRGTPRQGRAGLHVGWHGTQRAEQCAGCNAFCAPLQVLARAVYHGLRCTTRELSLPVDTTMIAFASVRAHRE